MEQTKTKEIKLSELLLICCQYNLDPLDIDAQERFGNLEADIICKAYLSFTEKKIAMMRFYETISRDEKDVSPVDFFILKEQCKLLYGVFGYTNIVIDIPLDGLYEQVIDTLGQCGIIDYIQQAIGNDSIALCRMMDEVLSISQVTQLLEGVYLTQDVKIDELIEQIKNAQKVLTPEQIADYKALMAVANPKTEALQKLIDNIAVDTAMENTK